MLPTIEWKDDAVVMIDQRKLPATEVYVTCRTANDVAKAIKTMVIRGAPAIGVAAAMGIALGMKRSKATGTRQYTTEFQKTCDLMAGTRPTAVNLFWAIERMKGAFSRAALAGDSVAAITAALEAEAKLVHDEDVASCKRWARTAPRSCRPRPRFSRTATPARWRRPATGPALGVIRGAVEAGKRVAVFATRRGRSCRAPG
jgi:methylthioribose-1-phosphate isomerase